MQTTVATIALDARLPVVLRQLLAAPEQVLVVIEAGQPTGVISLASVLAVLEQPTRTELLQALRSAGPAPAFAGADPDRTAAHLAAPAVTILELATQDDAIRSLLDQQAERLVVINAAGSLVGMLGRRALLRGLAQLSA
jgi:predicted transcriptional regulator